MVEIFKSEKFQFTGISCITFTKVVHKERIVLFQFTGISCITFTQGCKQTKRRVFQFTGISCIMFTVCSLTWMNFKVSIYWYFLYYVYLVRYHMCICLVSIYWYFLYYVYLTAYKAALQDCFNLLVFPVLRL